MIFLEDAFFDHRKVIAAGDDAVMLYLKGLGWLKQQRSTDGRIPLHVVPRLAPIIRDKAVPTDPLRQRLVAVELWEDDGTEVVCHGYVERNQKAIRKSEQAKGAARKRHEKAAATPPGEGPFALRTHLRPQSERTSERTADADEAFGPSAEANIVANANDVSGRHATNEASGRRPDREPPGQSVVSPSGRNAGAGANARADADATVHGPQSTVHSPPKTPPPSNGFTTVANPETEEEPAPPQTPTHDAARHHAERAYRAQPPGTIRLPSRWKAEAADRWLTEHQARAAQLLAEHPDLTGAELLDRVEPKSNPGYVIHPPVVLPEITDDDRERSRAVIAATRAAQPRYRSTPEAGDGR